MPVQKSQKGRRNALLLDLIGPPRGMISQREVGARRNTKKPGMADRGRGQFGGVAHREDEDANRLSGRAARAITERRKRSKQA